MGKFSWLMMELLLVSVLVSCSLPDPSVPEISTITSVPKINPDAISQPVNPSPEPPSESFSGQPEFDLTPLAGTGMLWFDNSNLVFVPSGEFEMGHHESKPSDHSPAHLITMNGFWIHQTEVTNDQYRLCVGAGVCSRPTENQDFPNWYDDYKRGGNPVVGVNWEQAQTYCSWIKGRLPTEAEWEKAARGDTGWSYPWGENEVTCNLANYKDCLSPSQPFFAVSFSNAASPYKLLNMTGNVSEWVGDWYGEDYYAEYPTDNPFGPETGSKRVVRGGSFESVPNEMYVFLREALEPEKDRTDLGFRCVLSGLRPGLVPACELPPAPVEESIQPEVKQLKAYGYGWCEYHEQVMRTGVNIFIDEALRESGADFLSWADGYPLNCSVNGGPPYSMYCAGLPSNVGLTPNRTLNIEVCQKFDSSQEIPTLCPQPEYVYDPSIGMCQLSIMYDVEAEGCPSDYVELSPGECVHRPSWNDFCYPGYYAIEYNWSDEYVCVPYDKCLLPGAALADPSCQVCLDGSTYDPERNCCSTEHPPRCGRNFILNEDQTECWPEWYWWERCANFELTIPICTSPTSPPQSCKNPDKYTNKSACEAANCEWKYTDVGLPYCGQP